MTARYLSTFLNYEKNLKAFSCRNIRLARVRRVLSKLDFPQKSLKIVHVAGSKGKGSTAVFIAQILSESGYKVGLYTSPHLYDIRERFRVLTLRENSRPSGRNEIFPGCISPKKWKRLVEQVRPVIDKCRHDPVVGDLTYFEVLTILAFYYFREQKVDFVVLETGLGGRLDATNVCQPLVSVITSISLEHTRELGKTLKKIAREKAGIIKKNSAVVIAPQASEVGEVINARCRKLGIVPVLASVVKRKISLQGEHQNVNAAVAVGAIDALRRLGFCVAKNAVSRGLANAFWPLRFEVVSKSPVIVLDGAHNPASCRCLAQTMKKNFPGRKVVLIFGSLADKDIAGMASAIGPLSSSVILTSFAHPRVFAWNAQKAKEIFPGTNVLITSSVKNACRQALKEAGTQGLILTAGSLFVAAQARKIFSKIL